MWSLGKIVRSVQLSCMCLPTIRKVILVAFDWGGVIAFRLASDAPEIADRFIIANSALVSR